MTHCAICHIKVARHDPERVVEGNEVFHRSCLRRRNAPTKLNCRVRPKQMFYRFMVSRMVH